MKSPFCVVLTRHLCRVCDVCVCVCVCCRTGRRMCWWKWSGTTEWVNCQTNSTLSSSTTETKVSRHTTLSNTHRDRQSDKIASHYTRVEKGVSPSDPREVATFSLQPPNEPLFSSSFSFSLQLFRWNRLNEVFWKELAGPKLEFLLKM